MATKDSRILVRRYYDDKEEAYVEDWVKDTVYDVNDKAQLKELALVCLEALLNDEQVRLAHWHVRSEKRKLQKKDLF